MKKKKNFISIFKKLRIKNRTKKSRSKVGKFTNQKIKNCRLKCRLNSVNWWLIGTSVKISVIFGYTTCQGWHYRVFKKIKIQLKRSELVRAVTCILVYTSELRRVLHITFKLYTKQVIHITFKCTLSTRPWPVKPRMLVQ